MIGRSRPARGHTVSVGRGWVQRFAAALLIGVLLSLLVSHRASAAPTSGQLPNQSAPQICAKASLDYQYLPVDRWNGATTTLHTRSSGGFGSLVDPAPVARQIQGSVFFAGSDFLFSLTSKIVSGATQFCPLKSVGGLVDRTAGTFGRAMINSPLLAGLVVAAVIGLLVQGVRRRNSRWIQRLVTKVMVVALFAIMVAGAMASTGGGADGDFNVPYKPGNMSPGWIATTVDSAVTSLASAPAQALSVQVISGGQANGDEIDCSRYLQALRQGYESATTDGVVQSKAAPSEVVSSLWEISAYNAWSVAQFGAKNLNGLQRVGCRMLDQNASIPVGVGTYQVQGQNATDQSSASVSDVLRRIPNPQLGLAQIGDYIKPQAPAWRPLNPVEADKAAIAWATCTPLDGKIANLSRRDGWKAPAGNSWLIADDGARKNAETVNGSAKLNTACYAFFNSTTDDTVDRIFDWGDGDKKINDHKAEMPPSVFDFISTLHGTNQVSSGSAALGYTVCALGVFIVFGGLGLVILIVKLMALVMLFGVLAVMLLVLLPNSDTSKLVAFGRQYIGLSFFSAFAVFFMALIVLITKVIWVLLNALPGSGPTSVIGMMAGGLAPMIAAVTLHVAFKKAGLPSPLTVSGATSWGKSFASGAAVSGVVTGVGNVVDRVRGARKGNRFDRQSRTEAAIESGRFGKRNKDLVDGSQKLPIRRHGEPVISPRTSMYKRTPEEILNSPTASAVQKRAAKREQLEGMRQQAEQQRAEKKEARQNDQQERKAMSPGRRVHRFAADRRMDAGRVLNRENLAKLPGAAATLLAAGAMGGLPGIGAAAGGMAARSAAAAVIAKRRERHADADQRRHQIENYRQHTERRTNPRPSPHPGTRPRPTPPRQPGTGPVDERGPSDQRGPSGPRDPSDQSRPPDRPRPDQRAGPRRHRPPPARRDTPPDRRRFDQDPKPQSGRPEPTNPEPPAHDGNVPPAEEDA